MLHRRLAALEQENDPILVGLIGCGRMGQGVINQVTATKGMRVAAVSDMQPGRAESSLEQCQRTGTDSICVTSKVDEGTRAVANGQVVVATDSRLINDLPIDVVVEATGIPASGARVAYDAILNHQHVVTLNVEADALVGPMLNRLSENAGVVYTVTAGDEPGALGGLFEWASSLGLTIVVAGKGCMHPIDWNADAHTLADEATEVGINPKMLASFRDGSKHCVEMCVVANGTGLVPDMRGTHAKAVSLDQMPKVLCPKTDGGILDQSGVVELTPPVFDGEGRRDLARSATPGVYLIVTTDHPQIQADFKYLLMGDGPCYLLHRPYHLCAIETPYSIARAALEGQATLNPEAGPVAEVATITKCDLKVGQILTGSGGPEITGQIDRHEICRRENLLPLALSYDATMVRNVPKGQALTLDDVEFDDESMAYQLWRLQQATFS